MVHAAGVFVVDEVEEQAAFVGDWSDVDFFGA